MIVVGKTICENDQRSAFIFSMYRSHQGRGLVEQTAELRPPELESAGLKRSIWLGFADTIPGGIHPDDQQGVF